MASGTVIASTRGSLADLARLTERSRQAISQLAKRKVFEVGGDGSVDLHLAQLAIASRVRSRPNHGATASSPPPPIVAHDADASLGYNEARTLREVAEARLAQLKLAEQQGDLVRVADVKAALAGKASALREGLLQIPARLAPMLAAEPDQARCHDILQAELRQVLAQLTTELKPAT